MMNNTILSPQPSHAGPVAPDKMTTVILDNSCSRCCVTPGVIALRPHFGLPLNPSSFITIFSHTYVTIYSHDYVTRIIFVLCLHDYMVFTTCSHMTSTFVH